MKFLHCSDIHLGKRWVGAQGDSSRMRFNDFFDSFEFTVDYAIQNNIDCFIISGDFFDKRELMPEILEKTENILEKLKLARIPVVVIEGNHDPIISGSESDSWIIYLQSKGYLKRPYYFIENDKYEFVPINIKDTNVYGLGYPGALAEELMKEFAKYISDSHSKDNILFVHTAIAGSDFLPGTINKEVIDLLKDKLKYIGGGHFHSFMAYPEDNPIFFIPGSLEYWDFGEIGQKKGFIIFDTNSLKYEFIDSKKRDALKVKIEIDEQSDTFAIIEEEMLKYDLNYKLLQLEIKSDNSINLDPERIRKYIDSLNPLKYQIKYNIKNDINSADINIKSIDDVEKEILQQTDSFSKNVELTHLSLLKMKSISEDSENNENLHDIFNNLLESLINDGAKNDN